VRESVEIGRLFGLVRSLLVDARVAAFAQQGFVCLLQCSHFSCRNLKSPEEVACLLRYAFKEKRHSCVRSIFAKCTDNHVCTNNTSALVMDEVSPNVESFAKVKGTTGY